jgi:hypothetical protein
MPNPSHTDSRGNPIIKSPGTQTTKLVIKDPKRTKDTASDTSVIKLPNNTNDNNHCMT